jgi:hypothetical protein
MGWIDRLATHCFDLPQSGYKSNYNTGHDKKRIPFLCEQAQRKKIFYETIK